MNGNKAKWAIITTYLNPVHGAPWVLRTVQGNTQDLISLS